MAVLVLGLRDDSRVKRKLSGSKLTLEQTLMAMVLDSLRFLCWTHTKEAHKGKPYKEKSILKTLNGEYENNKDELQSFKTIEEYERYMAQFEV